MMIKEKIQCMTALLLAGILGVSHAVPGAELFEVLPETDGSIHSGRNE